MSNIEQNLQKILSSRYGTDVRQAIHDGVHDCYEDGKAGAVDLVARERIDNLVANNNPTDGNSELIDIRVGADGETYLNAGDAVREQVSSLKEDIAESILNYQSERDITWDFGAIDNTLGAPVTSIKNRIRNQRLFVTSGTLKAADGYKIAVARYSQDNWDSFEYYIKYTNTIILPGKAWYVFIVKKDDDSDISEDFDITEMLHLKFTTDNLAKNIISLEQHNDTISAVCFGSEVIFNAGGLNPITGEVTDATNRVYSNAIYAQAGSVLRKICISSVRIALYKYYDKYCTKLISSTALGSKEEYTVDEPCYIRILAEAKSIESAKASIIFDASAVNLKDLNDNLKYEEISEWKTGRIINIVNENTYIKKFDVSLNSEWSCILLPVNENDQFLISGYGGVKSKLYAFTDRFGKILDVTEKENVYQKLMLTAPKEGYLIVNALNNEEHHVIAYKTNSPVTEPVRKLIKPPYMPDVIAPVMTVPNAKTTAMTYDEITEAWDSLQKKYPQYITKTLLGKDTSGELDMYLYDFIPDTITVDGVWETALNKVYNKNDYPTIVMDACIHGGERPCAKALLNLMTLIADSTDYSIWGWLRNNIHFAILPLANPWGYKNNKRGNVNNVDLNRNFEPRWELGDETAENDRYRGTAPLSEKESQYIDSILKRNQGTAICYYSYHTHGLFTGYNKMTNFSSPSLYRLEDMQNIGLSVTKMVTASGWENHNLPKESGYIGIMEFATSAMASYQGAKYKIPSACPEVMYRYYDGGTGEVYNMDLDCMNTEYMLYAVVNACAKFLYGN